MSAEKTWYVDIAKELGIANNRLYRQGRMYHVANVKVSSRNDFNVKIGTLPNTWALHGAWKMAFKNWLNSNRDRMDDGTLATVSKLAKWTDFRLAMKQGSTSTNKDNYWQVHTGNGALGQSKGLDGIAIGAADEWKLSEYISTQDEPSATPDSFVGHVLGAHNGSAGAYSSIGILLAFQETLNKIDIGPDDDGDGDVSDNLPIATGVWANMMEVHGSSEPVVKHLVDDYNEPPFLGSSFVGLTTASSLVAQQALIDPGSNLGGQIVTGGFEVPLGMLEIEVKDSGTTEYSIDIELVPGDYQGVASESMGTPKFTSKKTWSVR